MSRSQEPDPLDGALFYSGAAAPLRDLWVRLGIAMAGHRYFLHADPLLTELWSLDYADRVSVMRPEASGCWKAAAHAYLFELMRLLSASGGITKLVSGRAGLVSATEISWLDSEHFQVEAIRPDDNVVLSVAVALDILTASPLHPIVPLGARLFTIGDSSAPGSGEDALFALVRIPSGAAPNAIAETIAAGACRNLIHLFFLAERVESGDKGPIRELIASVARETHLVADLAAKGARRLASSPDTTGVVEPCPLPQALTDLNEASPGADLALMLTTHRARFERYAMGLGMGQS